MRLQSLTLMFVFSAMVAYGPGWATANFGDWNSAQAAGQLGSVTQHRAAVIVCAASAVVGGGVQDKEFGVAHALPAAQLALSPTQHLALAPFDKLVQEERPPVSPEEPPPPPPHEGGPPPPGDPPK